MPEPTTDDIDALVAPATPHFAYQLRARIESSCSTCPEDHAVRRYAAVQMDAARPARRTLPRRLREARACRAIARLGRDPERRARGRTAPAETMTFDGASVLVTGRLAGIGKAIALPLRRARGHAGRDRLPAQRRRQPRRPRRSCAALGAEPPDPRQRLLRARVARRSRQLGPLDVLVHNAATG